MAVSSRFSYGSSTVWVQGRRLEAEKHAGHARLAFFKGNPSASTKKETCRFELKSDKIAIVMYVCVRNDISQKKKIEKFISILSFRQIVHDISENYYHSFTVRSNKFINQFNVNFLSFYTANRKFCQLFLNKR